ncbi:hypothetical protein ABE205_19415 [Brevibacillus agri]|uniref:BC1872 family protein n=1 Tax=Brevibacillus agri TaxID=51101 RepID=UPI003D206329
MTEQQIIETLATNVMGWEVVNSEVTGKPRWFYQPDKQFCLEMIDWNPLQNIADAWMLVEKFEDSLTLESWEGFICEICSPVCVRAHEKTAQEAICKAALKVIGQDA